MLDFEDWPYASSPFEVNCKALADSLIFNLPYSDNVLIVENYECLVPRYNEKSIRCEYSKLQDLFGNDKEYDQIILIDVLDHISSDKQRHEVIAECLAKCTTDGHLFIRFHPYISRFGAHRPSNKAFEHLIDPQLEDFWISLDPIKDYRSLLNMYSYIESIHKFDLEKIIIDAIPLISEMWGIDSQALLNNMPIQFVDYIVSSNDSMLPSR